MDCFFEILAFFSGRFRLLSNTPFIYPVLVFTIFKTKISVAPTAVSSSITVAIFFFSTIQLTATHSASSRDVIVGARLPGVIFVAFGRSVRGTLY